MDAEWREWEWDRQAIVHREMPRRERDRGRGHRDTEGMEGSSHEEVVVTVEEEEDRRDSWVGVE